MRISPDLIDAVVAHAREEAPNECCGMIAADDGRAVDVVRATNAAASPLRFEIDGQELHDLLTAIEAEHELGGIYHSHTRSAPYPSQTDINFARFWPGLVWLIVGLAGEEAEVRAFRIDESRVDEIDLVT